VRAAAGRGQVFSGHRGGTCVDGSLTFVLRGKSWHFGPDDTQVPPAHIPAPAPAAILESLHHGPGRHRQSRVHTTAFIPARPEVRRVARVTARVLPVETGSHVPVPPRTTWHVQPYAHAGPPAVRVPHERRGVRAGSRL
jgi:hypothetical protein